MKKPVPLNQAVAMVPEGAVVMIGGFMGVGSPVRLIDEMVRQRRGKLTLISNDSARPGVGVGTGSVAALARTAVGGGGGGPGTGLGAGAGDTTGAGAAGIASAALKAGVTKAKIAAIAVRTPES